MDRIRVGVVIESFFHLPFWAALQKGLYRDAGLEVDFSIPGGIEETTAGLKQQQIDIGVGSPEHVIHDVEAGGSLRMVGGNVNRLTHHLIVQPEIKRLEDLRGKVLGVSALTGGTSSLFIDILARVGLQQGDYTIVAAGTVPPRHVKLQRREIDAGMQTDPHNYIAEDAGFTNLGPVSQWIPFFNFNSINVRSDWAAANSAALTRFLAASIESSRWIFEQRAASVQMASEWMKIERKYADRAWDDHVSSDALPLDLHIKQASTQTALDMMRRDRTVRLAADANPAKYVDMRYLEAAQKKLGMPIHTFPQQ
jgi:NitT/TauT family transport system substrate-binding protein